ncbi:MAG: ATP synthase F1 subunit gamma [Chloroflexota bacterium]|nr:MAG: ATP synthase F1 subunit gamma [Chloroflexota bacterium]
MISVRLVRRRIRSVQNTQKVTNAMQMISASKMRRGQARVLATRPYAEKMREVLADLASVPRTESDIHPLLEEREARRIGVVLVTSDRGFCGGFNGNMNRRAASFMLEQSVPSSVIAVGRKGRDFMVRYRRDLMADFTGLGDQPSFLDTLPISRIVIDEYTAGNLDRVYLAYTRFQSLAVQRPVIQQLLPIQPPAGFETQQRHTDYIYEPNPQAVLAALLPRYVEMQVYHAVLESVASEHSARMVAMRNATDAAEEMVQELTLVMNKARQEQITKELLELAGGAAALA